MSKLRIKLKHPFIEPKIKQKLIAEFKQPTKSQFFTTIIVATKLMDTGKYDFFSLLEEAEMMFEIWDIKKEAKKPSEILDIALSIHSCFIALDRNNLL